MDDAYRPLSKMGMQDPDLDTLHEEVPPWMAESIRQWLEPLISWKPSGNPRRPYKQVVERMERVLRLRPPFDWSKEWAVHIQLLQRAGEPGPFGMDCVGYLVATMEHADAVRQVPGLNEILHEAGSAWEASAHEDGYRLTRRDLAAARSAISEIEGVVPRAGEMLVDAWQAVATRDPRPNEGYDKAVKAVEAAAQPTVQPNHAKATLGTILGELRANPERWSFVLGNIDLVTAMMERLWTTHIRHGTDVRTDHTLAEADAALHLSIPLVRFFIGGMITPA